MPIRCVGDHTARQNPISIPGSSTLTFDVQITGSVAPFEVRYTIVTQAQYVRFAGGSASVIRPFNPTRAMFTVESNLQFVCANGTPAGLVAFTVVAEVFENKVFQCSPNRNPSIQVSRWNCPGVSPAEALHLEVLKHQAPITSSAFKAMTPLKNSEDTSDMTAAGEDSAKANSASNSTEVASSTKSVSKKHDSKTGAAVNKVKDGTPKPKRKR